VGNLVDRVVGKERRRGGHGPAPGQGEILFSVGTEDFQFIDPGLGAAAGLTNDHAHESGIPGREGDGLRQLGRSPRRKPRERLLKLIGHPSRRFALAPLGNKSRHQKQTDKSQS